MATALKLPIIDLSSPDRLSSAASIRQACIEYGFFYLVNHGVKEELLAKVLEESKKFFSLPLEEKMKLARKEHRGYTPLYAEILDPSSNSKGDSKESYYIGPLEDCSHQKNLNQWPPEDTMPSWKSTMESYYREVESVGRKLLSLIALSLNLENDFFEKIGALNKPSAFLRLLHYPDEVMISKEEIYGASAHSDYGMVTLLATDGVPGLQVCRDKDKHQRCWEAVPHINGAFIVNIGDMMERWTNCLFRSTLHRVMPAGQERFSMAFFFDPDEDCVVECLKSCCSDSFPPRFPPIRSGEYLRERLRLTYGS
ncbi:2-oxoglutarate-Fe(II) type oxidoreductase hxnY-like isoform X1 [Syzygium oleosum]|uniref:2-oxoglutarate-Fe(II) type oxidoreductase hxnY-like isoform X1 n=2 Tax=Syzygium oleosum TaxID=219896 RepID=UPI0024B8D8D8|nr:2-oxoglutarate-Fe(II) type oxidoreductase hxnY-like isoform X1 [Syzygium oleosum]